MQQVVPACIVMSSSSHDPQLPCCIWCAAVHRHPVQEAVTHPEIALQLLWHLDLHQDPHSLSSIAGQLPACMV